MLVCDRWPLIIVRADSGTLERLDNMIVDFMAILNASDNVQLLFDIREAPLPVLQRFKDVINNLFDEHTEVMESTVQCVGIVVKNRMLKELVKPSVIRLGVPGKVFHKVQKAEEWIGQRIVEAM